MLVMVLEAVPEIVRGELSRWLTPLGSGVFIGRVSSDVRDHLWNASVSKAGRGRIVQAWAARGEPGYAIRLHGFTDARVVNLDGVPMVAIEDAAWREAVERFRLTGAPTETGVDTSDR